MIHIEKNAGIFFQPPNCNPFQRVKRQALVQADDEDRSIEVFTGLYVSEDPDFEDEAEDVGDIPPSAEHVSHLFVSATQKLVSKHKQIELKIIW